MESLNGRHEEEVNGIHGTPESVPTKCVHIIDLVGPRLEDSTGCELYGPAHPKVESSSGFPVSDKADITVLTAVSPTRKRHFLLFLLPPFFVFFRFRFGSWLFQTISAWATDILAMRHCLKSHVWILPFGSFTQMYGRQIERTQAGIPLSQGVDESRIGSSGFCSSESQQYEGTSMTDCTCVTSSSTQTSSGARVLQVVKAGVCSIDLNPDESGTIDGAGLQTHGGPADNTTSALITGRPDSAEFPADWSQLSLPAFQESFSVQEILSRLCSECNFRKCLSNHEHSHDPSG